MQIKNWIRTKDQAILIGLSLALIVPSFPTALAEGEISAEDQRLRDLFLKVRKENRQGDQTPQTRPTPPAPKPAQQGSAPPKPSPRPVPQRAKPSAPPPAAPPQPVVRSVPEPPAPTPRPTPPPEAAESDSTRFGHGSPPLPTPEPSSQPARPKPEVVSPPRPAPSASKGTPKVAPKPLAEDTDGMGDKLRTLADSLKERLSSLPRTEQSRAMEVAESEPASSREPKDGPIPVKKTGIAPPTLAKKPAETRPAPVPKVGPEIPSPAPSPPEPEATPSEKLIAKASRSMRGIDTDPLLEDRKLDLKVDEPSKRESLATTAESIRRSLLEDEDEPAESGPAAARKTEKPAPSAVTPVLPAAPEPEIPASSPSPVTRTAPPATSSGGMTGAVFERLVRQAMALGITAALSAKPAPKGLPEPEIPTDPPAPAPPVVAAIPDPEDDVPEYVKAARRLGESLDGFPTLPEDNRPPGLNDFVISATHQTDFDMASSSITFAGHVIVESSRFHLTCDKFIVHMLPEQKGMDFGEALGNVVIHMMEKRKPTGHTGLARSAIYRPQEGEITLSGWPRIVEETKELVGITADAQMVLTTSGSVRTIGRNRTILKQ